jgi:hypothetical protein
MSECANPEHAGAGDACAACLASVCADLTRMQDRQARAITRERELERDMRAAIRRGLVEHELGPFAAAFMRGEYSGQRDLVHEALYRASQLQESWGRRGTDRDKIEAARHTAAWALREHGEALKADRGHDRLQEAWDTAPMVAEAARLRAYITETGQAMHGLVGGARHLDETGRCRCAGCELIRGMDDVPVPEVASDAS